MEIINLTPHPLAFYASRDSPNPYFVVPSKGELRLKSAPQCEFPALEFFDGPNSARIPMHAGQKFVGIDEASSGWSLWIAKPDAAFVVSLPAASYIAAHPDEIGLGARKIYCPATDPKNVVRDSKGAILGCISLELHAPLRW